MALCRSFFTHFPNSLPNTFSKDWHILRYVTGRLPSCIACRTLLSESTIRLEHHKRQRIFTVDNLQHQGKIELFETLNKIESTIEARQYVFKVVDATHCAESKEECEIIEKVLKILMTSTDNESNDFIFGASVIRMYHYLDMPDGAFKAFKNLDFGHALKDNTCHLLLMDLLYKHGQYSRAVDVYFAMEKFNIECTTLAFGSLYHINSPESLVKSQSLLIHVATNYAVSRRAVLFAAMHALNQGDPNRAIETLKFCKADTTSRNIELTSLCRLHRVKNILSHLLETLSKTDTISQLWGLRIYSDVWQEILSVMESQSTKEEKEEFEQMKKELEHRGVLSRQKTDIFLERTIPGDVDYRKERAKRIIHRTANQQPP